MRCTNDARRRTTSRRVARAAILAAAVPLTIGACTVQPPTRARIEIDPTNSPLWLTADEAEAYRCTMGLLECSDVGGRIGARRCRCVE